MKHSIENNIRRHAFIIYSLVTLLCCGMILYLYNLRNNIESQKSGIEQARMILSMTNEILYSVNQAQSEANLYTITKSEENLDEFRRMRGEIEIMIDTLAFIYLAGDTTHAEMFTQINDLLKTKEENILLLNQEFRTYKDPLLSINETLKKLEKPAIADSVQVSTIVSDTVINVSKKKNFWKRLGDAFSPGKAMDTVITVTALQQEKIEVNKTDSVPILADVASVAEKARINYNRRLNTINQQVNKLLSTDQEISHQISQLLHQLHRETLDSTLLEIEESEEAIRQNHTTSIIGSILSLLLIFILFMLIIHDVNNGYRARQSLEKANERIRQIMESRHKLLLSISHDIKTPLNAILGYLDLWKKEHKIPEEDISLLQNPGMHILSLLADLLNFSSLEQGNLKLSEITFSPIELINGIEEMCAPLIKQKQLSLEKEIRLDRSLILQSDALKIKQIIINIISNAIKYTKEGKISIEVGFADNRLSIAIRDTGVGIQPDKVDTLFAPFARIDENSLLAEGNGYGMYVVKGLVDLLEGSITVTSEIGVGTCIQTEIPVKVMENKEIVDRKDVSVCVGIFDDDETLILLLKKMLARMGHTSKEFLVNDTIPLFDTEGLDHILTDLEMREVKGLDILAAARDKNVKIPVTVMTGRADINNEKALEMGFDSYLSKPFTFETLGGLLGGTQDNGDTKKLYQLAPLAEFYQDDQDALREIIDVFVESTRENLQLLQASVEENNFQQAQSLCHKMLPMFMQIEATEAVTILKKMDSLRGTKEEVPPEWKEEIKELIRLVANIINSISEEVKITICR